MYAASAILQACNTPRRGDIFGDASHSYRYHRRLWYRI